LIIDDRKLKGIVTDGDLRRFLYQKKPIHETCARDVMTNQPKTISSKKLAIEAKQIMQEFQITQLVVTDESGDVAGLLHIHDLTRAGIL